MTPVGGTDWLLSSFWTLMRCRGLSGKAGGEPITPLDSKLFLFDARGRSGPFTFSASASLDLSSSICSGKLENVLTFFELPHGYFLVNVFTEKETQTIFFCYTEQKKCFIFIIFKPNWYLLSITRPNHTLLCILHIYYIKAKWSKEIVSRQTSFNNKENKVTTNIWRILLASAFFPSSTSVFWLTCCDRRHTENNRAW